MVWRRVCSVREWIIDERKPGSDRGAAPVACSPGLAGIRWRGWRRFHSRVCSARSGRRAVESIVPRRTFDDVILPPATRRALDTALAQVTQHDLIFQSLGPRRVALSSGLGLAFNFAGPPGTGKTICGEAIAHSLGMTPPRRPLRRARIDVDGRDAEERWAAIFGTARDQRAVLLFDEADAIAARRSIISDHGLQQRSEHPSSACKAAEAGVALTAWSSSPRISRRTSIRIRATHPAHMLRF